ncbi:MAG TPA: helix-turn-helix domain-containing protein [Bacteroidales bacterium]|nr:helix-turn-helix domain-containing protein [Bacteroidales bacterium]
MKEKNMIRSISEYNDSMGAETLNPLISMVDYSKAPPPKSGEQVKMSFDFYFIALKEIKCGNIKYGCNYYDYQEGTLVFIGPGQVLTVENYVNAPRPKGKALLFHPDLIRGTSLGHTMKNYTFFSYEVHEALHLSEKERQVINNCFANIEAELMHTIDKHSKTMIISNIELLLNYSVRFYDRQFITRTVVNQDILIRFEKLLDEYFNTDKPRSLGLPSVKYCADKLHLSANYFGDLIKKETGKSPLDHIQFKIADIAKDRIMDGRQSASEIAYELGFKNPQHFSRMFKQIVGMTPLGYRGMN